METVTAPTILGLYVQGIKDLGIRFIKEYDYSLGQTQTIGLYRLVG